MFRELRAQKLLRFLGCVWVLLSTSEDSATLDPCWFNCRPNTVLRGGGNKNDVFLIFLSFFSFVPATGSTFFISLREALNRVLLSHFSDSIM